MNPLKLGIVGGGPSAFYVASRILKTLPKSVAPDLRIHVLDRLWAPHGLVRYGVAPDHPEVKNCTHKFDLTAGDSRFRFFGNVNVVDGTNPISHTISLPLSSVFKNYSHVLFATGCTLPILHGALPPSKYCVPAISIVHWYTQHPLAACTPPPPLDRVSHISIIGNGNVSLDVARILLMDVGVLAKYDVPKMVLDVLSRSTVKHVSIIGRRGPLEAAFTMKELREMINLPEASMIPLETSLVTPPSDGPPLTRQQTRALQLLQRGSRNLPGSRPKTWSLEFFRSPIGLTPPESTSSSVQLSLAHTSVEPTTRRAVPTGEVSTISTDLIITSLGFQAEPNNFYDPALRHMRNIAGRITDPEGRILKNVYSSGWASTGAKGVLASTLMDAYSVADTIIADWKTSGGPVDQLDDFSSPSVDPAIDGIPREVQEGLQEGLVTQYDDWKRIDAEERKRGEELGKERERMDWAGAQRFMSYRSLTPTSDAIAS